MSRHLKDEREGKHSPHAQIVTELVSKVKSAGWITPSVFKHLSDKSCSKSKVTNMEQTRFRGW